MTIARTSAARQALPRSVCRSHKKRQSNLFRSFNDLTRKRKNTRFEKLKRMERRNLEVARIHVSIDETSFSYYLDGNACHAAEVGVIDNHSLACSEIISCQD